MVIRSMMSIATGMDGFHCFVLPFFQPFPSPSLLFALLYFTYDQLVNGLARRKPFALVPGEPLFLPQTCMAGLPYR